MTRRTYTEKEQVYKRRIRRLQRNQYREQVGLPVEQIAAETELLANAHAYRTAEMRDEMTLRRWLVRYGHVLWSEPIEVPPTVVPLDPTNYSWLSGSCG